MRRKELKQMLNYNFVLFNTLNSRFATTVVCSQLQFFSLSNQLIVRQIPVCQTFSIAHALVVAVYICMCTGTYIFLCAYSYFYVQFHQ